MKADFTLDNLSDGFEGSKDLQSINQNPDVQLWARFQAGDLSALETIYSTHFSGMFSYAVSLVMDSDMAKDAIQDIFIELWQKKENLGKVKAIRPYLYTILRRKVLEQARNNGKLLSLVEGGKQDTKTAPSPEKEYILHEKSHILSEALDRAVQKLSKKQQELIHLKYYDKLNNKQIAQITEIPYSQVCYHLKTALQQLQSVLHYQRH